MRITTKAYFNDYQNQLDFDLESMFHSMYFDSKIDFISAAVFSCNIEGNDLTVQRYIDLKPPSFFELAKDFQEIENVTKSYEFAKANKLTEQNFLKAHQIITWKLLKPFNKVLIAMIKWAFLMKMVWCIWRLNLSL